MLYLFIHMHTSPNLLVQSGSTKMSKYLEMFGTAQYKRTK